MTDALPSADVRRSDLVIGAVVIIAVFGGSLVALAHARLSHHAELPVIDPGVAIPIAVRPVSDLPAGGAAPGRQATDASQAPAVPRAWRRRVARPVEPTMPATPWSEPEPEPEPAIALDPDAPVAPERKRTKPKTPGEPPPPDQPPVEPDPGEPTEPGPDAPTDPNPDATEDGPPTEGGGGAEGESEGEGAGPSQGEGGEGGGTGTDPLLDRAIAFYRARLVAWFSARFRVTASGLSPAELAKHRVRAQIELGDDLRIVDYRILSSDHPAFENAARNMLEKLRNESLPAPPENYPGAVQRQLTVTFTCAEDTCD